MKMLVATTLVEHKYKIEEFFGKHNVPFYNEFELKSIDKTGKPEHRVGNWFAQGKIPYDHIGFIAIIEDEQVDNILSDLKDCHKVMPEFKVHAYSMSIDKAI